MSSAEDVEIKEQQKEPHGIKRDRAKLPGGLKELKEAEKERSAKKKKLQQQKQQQNNKQKQKQKQTQQTNNIIRK